MRAVLFAVAIVALVAGLATPGVALGGSIKGTVVLKGATPELRKLAVTIDQYVCGKEKSPEDLLVSPQGRIRNAVVWLDKAPAGSAGGGSGPDATRCGCGRRGSARARKTLWWATRTRRRSRWRWPPASRAGGPRCAARPTPSECRRPWWRCSPRRWGPSCGPWRGS